MKKERTGAADEAAMLNILVHFRCINLNWLVLLALGGLGLIGVRLTAELAIAPIPEAVPCAPMMPKAPNPEAERRFDDARRAPSGRRPPGSRRRRASPQIPGRAPCSAATH